MIVEKIQKIEFGDELLGKIKLNPIKMQPVPAKAVVTSKYIRETIDETKYGKVGEILAGLCRDEEKIAVVMRWEDKSKDDTISGYGNFVDACAVMFPIKEYASVMTMGSEDAPVNVWLWRADEKFYDIISKGLGTTKRRDPKTSGLTAHGQYSEGKWTVFFIRPLQSKNPEEYVDLTPPKTTSIAFAVWIGNNRERGPLKSYSGDFLGLEVPL
ncbi:MAG: ethylbenzene dehydrogenase-related protein [Archaeoglobaceae archaeon]|nr:ethylbenzene dehydrogenase-related protein [Archaeoglobaceae archaeon]MDW8118464.1 ethylbenzene dehydrogenase-related protein [Archaeoglobaceae archaeon]